MRLHFRYPCSERMVPGSCWQTQCSHSTPIKVVAHVCTAQCGVFCAHPQHSNAAEWHRTKLKANRWHPLPLRKLSRGTTSFLAISCYVHGIHCFHRQFPVTFSFQHAPLLLVFFHSLSYNKASLKASWGSGLQFMNVKLFKGHTRVLTPLVNNLPCKRAGKKYLVQFLGAIQSTTE